MNLIFHFLTLLFLKILELLVTLLFEPKGLKGINSSVIIFFTVDKFRSNMPNNPRFNFWVYTVVYLYNNKKYVDLFQKMYRQYNLLHVQEVLSQFVK